MLKMCAYAILDGLERGSALSAACHAQTAVVVLVGGHSGAVGKAEPSRLYDGLTESHVAADAIGASDGEERLGYLYGEVGVVATHEQP